jgi:N-acetylglucosaminyldiphosphoundecaprenol N-acetyl-beta-D-mannosaminyltransferase
MGWISRTPREFRDGMSQLSSKRKNTRASFSIVIPAYAASPVIGPCLRSFMPGLHPGEAEVAVLSFDGDGTAQVAAGFDGVAVVELDARVSDAEAIAAGEAAVATFPRLYLDPSCVVSADDLRLLVDALDLADVSTIADAELGRPNSLSRAIEGRYDIRRRIAPPRQSVSAGFSVFPSDSDDRLWVQRGIGHHLGAVAVASTVTENRRSAIGSGGEPAAGATPITERRRTPRSEVPVLIQTPPATAPAPAGPRVTIDGVPFDRVTEAEAIGRVLDDLAANEGGLLLTPNVDIVRQLREPGNADLPEQASLIVADGSPIVWASSILGDPLPARVTGSSLIWSLTGAAARTGRRVMLLGGAEGVAERAAHRLERHNPKLQGVQWHYPPFGFDAKESGFADVCAAVEKAEPDVVFVGLGFPRQERLALRLLERFPGTWFVGCGGGITMTAGDVSRAPSWMQDSGLEWAYRLGQEPQRLARRYLVDDLPYALGMLARTAGRRVRAWPALSRSA